MFHNFSDVLAGPAKAARQVEDVLREAAHPDFDRSILPEALAAPIASLS